MNTDKVIKGPITITNLYNPHNGSMVCNMGDEHYITNEKCSEPEYDVVQLLKDVSDEFEKDKTEFLDIFLESPLTKRSLLEYGRIEKAQTNYIYRIESEFSDCFSVDKTNCRYKYVRFHYVDIRSLTPFISMFTGITMYPIIRYLGIIYDRIMNHEESYSSIMRYDENGDVVFSEVEEPLPPSVKELETMFEKVSVENKAYSFKFANKFVDAMNILFDIFLRLINAELRRYNNQVVKDIILSEYEKYLSEVRKIINEPNFKIKVKKFIEKNKVHLDDLENELERDIRSDLNEMYGGNLYAVQIFFIRAMDLYTLARMFGKGYDKNVIIYSGDTHAQYYNIFLTYIGYKVEYKTERKPIQGTSNASQCSLFRELKSPKRQRESDLLSLRIPGAKKRRMMSRPTRKRLTKSRQYKMIRKGKI